ncbi:hypothetical protein K3495_g5847 [Podosphaera aphanis]|nr:hypothetical protein K3495_g5847 [Podosphaera aphanis]
MPVGVTKHKDKARKSMAPSFPPEWASSREAFRKAIKRFEFESFSSNPEKKSEPGSIIFPSPGPLKQEKVLGTLDQSTPSNKPQVPNYISSSLRDNLFSVVPREVMLLFTGLEKLDENNWYTWKGHMRDSLEMCDLWDIITGKEKKPPRIYANEIEAWTSARTASDVWDILTSLHQSTGAQGKVDLIWKFWSKRCAEGSSVKEHIGDIRATHMELAEMGIIVEDYQLAIMMSKSLPSSYDNCVSTIFAGIKDLEEADSRYVANKIFEEMRRESRSEDANVAYVPPKSCSNCKKPGHTRENCYGKGGGKDGQGPRQIARRKKIEADRKKEEEKPEQNVQVAERDAFYSSHMALDGPEYIHFTSYSLSSDSWIADSGASAHIANRREMFATFVPCKRKLNVAGGLTAEIEGMGTVYMRSIIQGRTNNFKLTDVLYVPTTRFCLLSGPKIDKAGGKVTFGNNRCSFSNAEGDQIANGTLDGNLYRVNAKAPHSPLQNGVSERMNRTLMDLARAMLIEKKLPEFLWGEAVLHASWVRNRSPTVILKGKTPIEVLTKTCPNLSMAQEFGKDVYVLEETPRPKTQSRARKFIFTGFEDGPKAIRYYGQNTMKIKSEANRLEGESLSHVSDVSKPIIELQKSDLNQRCLRSITKSGTTTRKDYAELAGFNPRKHIRKPQTGNSVYTASEGYQNGDFYANSPHFANIAYGLMEKNGDDKLPNTIQEAREHHDCKNWIEAAQKELDTLKEKQTWELVDPPTEGNVIGNDGLIGFDSFRLVLAIAAYHGLEIGQVDIKGAYLNGNLSENIYMKQPKGFEDGTERVCRLIHTLYGLKQSGREWNKTLKNFLVEKVGYIQLIKEHGLFIRSNANGYDIIAVWVDDFLIASTDKVRLNRVKNEICSKWEATDLGEPKLLLGIQVERDPRTKSIRIFQEQYILKILNRFGMEACTPANNPLPSGVIYSKTEEEESFDDTTKHRAAIGSLMFASIATRPDITYATNLMSQFNEASSQKHWNGVKHNFRYLKGTISTGIMYSKIKHTEPKFTLTAYSDADNGKGYDR